ncbi:D-tagatose-1,6-bisphosphate aldolase subunit [Trema orientale]|uniref:D-tagatose-1,6-bisphosphate aldolase subunit n=1 Tax=Trema orientale TaxID=63057 RepID=A0A2P5FVC1_TREOI|nr:D-tagatose-1,6-bisphosphate aldolase subunit [Trema orientale]
MAEASTFSCVSPISLFSKEFSPSFFSALPSRSSFSRRRRSSPLLRFAANASSSSSSSDSGNFFSDDSSGLFPWSDGDSEIHWVPDGKVTFFTSDGLIQIGGSMVPRRITSSDKQGRLKTAQRFQRFQESDYMDPKQEICLGALFDIAATNGLDMGRRLCIFGFCRSIEMLSDVVEDTVLEHGGEVVSAEKAIKGGLHERLTMTVAVPLLWGVPPVSETLHLAVQSGGGIVDKVYWQWDFL